MWILHSLVPPGHSSPCWVGPAEDLLQHSWGTIPCSLCHIPSPATRDTGSVTRHWCCDRSSVAQPGSDTTQAWRCPSVEHLPQSGEGVAQTGVGSSPFTGGSWGRWEGASHRLCSGTCWGSLRGSQCPQQHPGNTTLRGQRRRRSGQRSSSRMKSRGDGFQLSDVQGSLKALAGGVPGRWHLVTATGTQGGACLVGRALLLPIGCWQPTTLQLPGAELGEAWARKEQITLPANSGSRSHRRPRERGGGAGALAAWWLLGHSSAGCCCPGQAQGAWPPPRGICSSVGDCSMMRTSSWSM